MFWFLAIMILVIYSKKVPNRNEKRVTNSVSDAQPRTRDADENAT
jgi:hypothetical protein